MYQPHTKMIKYTFKCYSNVFMSLQWEMITIPWGVGLNNYRTATGARKTKDLKFLICKKTKLGYSIHANHA